mmetsp:Transcript_49975/g.98730  ORF Transcript_49975/g.98730 Transcript_49975/m.98730 type:complete len:330 (+) Transcript_49975:2-991(+)
MKERRVQSLRDAEEAADIGFTIAETLAGQTEQLEHTGRTMDKTEYNLALSRRMVRGMTWTGWVQNMISSEPPPPQRRICHRSGRGVGSQSSSKFSSKASESHTEISCEETSVKAQLRAQDAYLSEQLGNLNRLSNLGGAISDNVTTQNRMLENLGDQVDRSADETRSIIRMEGRLHKSVRGKPIFRGIVSICHEESGEFLCVLENAEVGLGKGLNSTTSAARWELHTRDDGVTGFRSVLSHGWLGQNILGKVLAKAHAFGNWEGWDIDLFAREGPLLCCSANAYAGGWAHIGRDGHLVASSSSSLEGKADAPKWRIIFVDGTDGLAILK